jgi:MOSC domain-containing protein YiiM
MDPVREAAFVEGEGLSDSVDRSRRRQVTLIESEAWERMMVALAADIDPAARRANVMLSGVSLANTRGRVLRLGPTVRLAIGGETTPCERMEEALTGLQEMMRDNWSGGAFAQVLTGGAVRVGDPVEWEPSP